VQLLPNKIVTVVGDINFKNLTDSSEIITQRNVNNIINLGKYKFQFVDNLDRDLFTLCFRFLIDKFQIDPTRMSDKDLYKQKEFLFQKSL
jgi:hypothetical protein